MKGLFWNGNIENNFLAHQLSEVYKDRVYHPLLSGKHGLTIVDLGANVGVTSHYFVRFAKMVYAVEPAIEHFTALCKMIEFNRFRNITPLKKAIGIKNGKIELLKNKSNVTQHSTNQVVKQHIGGGGWGEMASEIVECVTLDKLFEENEIEHCDFMKMDIEGAEAEVLGHTSFKKVAPKIDTIVLENHFWTGRHPHQTIEALKNNGFAVTLLKKDQGSEILVATK